MTATRKLPYFHATLAHLRILALLFIPSFACWDYGGVLPWTQWALGLSTVIILVLSLPQLILQPRQMPLTRCLVIICLGVALAGFLQTVSLPSFMTAVLSRGTYYAHRDFVPAALREEALQSTDPSLNALANNYYPTSIAPQLTRGALLLPLLMAAFILLSARAFNSERRLLLGLAGLTLSGAVIAFLGIADQIRPPEVNSVLIDIDGKVFGTFVNRNNAAAYLNIAIAAAAGLIVWRYRWQRRLRPWDDRFDVAESGWYELISERVRRLFSYSDTLILIFLLAASVIFTGILIGGSRGGFVGSVVGGFIAVWRGFARKQAFMQTAVVALGAILCGLLLMLVGMANQVQERLGTLLGDDLTSDGRLDHWRDAMYTAWMFFPTGSGLGTYRFAYLPYQETSAGNWFVNADNLYLEMLVEGGVWLPLLVAGGGLSVFLALQRLAKFEGEPHLAGLLTTAWFASAALLTSQTFDFGLLLPANYLSLAILLGMTVGTADRWNSDAIRGFSLSRHKGLVHTEVEANEVENLQDDSHLQALDSPDVEVAGQPQPTEAGEATTHFTEESTQTNSELDDTQANSSDISENEQSDPESSSVVASSRTPELRRSLWNSLESRLAGGTEQSVLAVLIVLALVTTVSEKGEAALIDYWMRTERTVASGGVEKGLLVTEVDGALTKCVSDRLYDSLGHLTLAKLQIAVDRVGCVEESLKGTAPSLNSPQDVWHLSAPEIQRASFYSGAYSAETDPSFVLLKGQSLERLKQARCHALKALLASPLDDSPRHLLLSLDYLAHDHQVSQQLLEQIGFLRRNWAPALQAAAMLAVIHPGAEAAISLWNRALVVQPTILHSLWSQTRLIVSDKTFALALPDSPTQLLNFAQMTRDSGVRADVLSRAERALLKNFSTTLETAGLHYFQLATLAKLNGNDADAKVHFASAVMNNPSMTEWRYEYALALEKEGSIREALEELRRCILQNPNEYKYQKKERELRNR